MAPPALDIHSGEIFISQNAPAEKPQVFNYSQSHIIGHLDKDTSGYSTILSAAEQEKDKFAQGFEISSQDFVNRNVNTPTWKAFLTESHRFIIQPPCSERIVTSGKESLVCLLDLAESLDCSEVLVVLPVNGEDYHLLVKAFMYLGFAPVAPNTASHPGCSNYCVLGYSL